MKSSFFLSILFLPFALVVFWGCNQPDSGQSGSEEQTLNATSEDIDKSESKNSEENEVQDYTKVVGSLPSDMEFYDAYMKPDNKTVDYVSDASTFSIQQTEDSYWATWQDSPDAEPNEERIVILSEVEPEKAYKIQTYSKDGYRVYDITKVNEEGIWVMTNTMNRFKGYLCTKSAVERYKRENDVSDGLAMDDNPESIIASLGTKWTPLTRQPDGKWVIYEECLYGSGGMTWDDNGTWIEYSGGGDAWSQLILKLERIDDNVLRMVTKNELNQQEQEIIITIMGADFIMFNEGEPSEQKYVLSEVSSIVPTIKEECDEDEN